MVGSPAAFRFVLGAASPVVLSIARVHGAAIQHARQRE
jgi:hypothetical protein